MTKATVDVIVKGRGNSRYVFVNGHQVGRLERRVGTQTTRGTEDGKAYTGRKSVTSWRAYNMAGRYVGELASMAAWKRWWADRTAQSERG